MRRRATIVAVGLVLLAAPPTGAAEPSDPLIVGNVPVTADAIRIAGDDRYATAVAVSMRFNAPGEDTVVVATGEDFADALAGGTLAAQTGSPILLVTHDEVPGATADELRRLQPRRIVVLGGTAAVSDPVAGALGAFASVVERVAGVDRFGTAAEIAARFPSGLQRAYVANAFSPAEALVASAAAAHAGGPLLLVYGDAVPDATAYALSRLQAQQTLIVGEPALVSDAVLARVDELSPGLASRLGGAGPAATAAMVMHDSFPFGPKSEAVLASRSSAADALAAGPLALAADAPLLVADRECIEDPVRHELERLRPERVLLVGGTAALADDVERTSCEIGATNVTYELGDDVTAHERNLIEGGVEGIRHLVGGFEEDLLVQAYRDRDELADAAAPRPVRYIGDAARGWVALDVSSMTHEDSAKFMGVAAHYAVHHVQLERAKVGEDAIAEWLLEGGGDALGSMAGRREETGPAWGFDDYDAARLANAQGTPLSTTEEGNRAGAFDAGYAGVFYIVEKVGLDGYLEIFDRIGAGATWQAALEGVMGVDLEQFYADEAAWLRATS